MNDFIKECNQYNLKVEPFERVWCVRCQNESCYRSKDNHSAWSSRMSSQINDVFNPERADIHSPEYEQIHRQEFVCLNPQTGEPTVMNQPLEFVSKQNVIVDQPNTFVSGSGTKPKIIVVQNYSDKPKPNIDSPGPNSSSSIVKEMVIEPGAVVKMGK